MSQYLSSQRKPESGAEIEKASCASSGVLARIKLAKGTTAKDEDVLDDDPHAIATLYNLLSPWATTNRTAVGDAFISSVTAAYNVLDNSMKFIGSVNHAARKFPIMHFLSRELYNKGDLICTFRRDS